jgi:hypothetical protein
VERENAFFKSSPVDEYHLPQTNSEKVLFDVAHFPFGFFFKNPELFPDF